MISDRTKVFYFIPSLVQGGAERQILELIRRLPPRFDPVLCLYHDEVHYRELLPAGQPRHVLGVRRMTPSSLARLVEILRAERPAIFHSYLNRANFWGRIAALHAGVPVVISSCRARMIELRYLVFERLLAAHSQRVLVNSVGIQRELQTLAGVPAERIDVVPNFLDLDFFRPPDRQQRAAARARWGLEAGQRAVLIPGRVCLQKHQLAALLAFDGLAARGSLPSAAQLLLAGRLRGGTVRPLVERLVERRPALRARVRLLGAQRDIRSLYWAADLLLLPSLWEGLPNAALEGCACGLPALVSHAANLDHVVDHGVTGVEVPTAHRPALQAALSELLRLPEEELRVIGQRARQRMEARYCPVTVLDRIVETYDRLLQQQRSQSPADGAAPPCAG